MVHYISGVTVADNDGGIIKANGSTSNTKFNQTSTPTKDLGVFASTVIDGSDTDPALVSGVFAYNNSKPVAKKITTSINTVNNSVLLSGALLPNLIQSVKKLKVCTGGSCSDGVRTSQVTKAIRNDKFNIYSGKFDVGFPQVVVDNYETDKEADVTRSSQGGFVYLIGSSPVVRNYVGKTGWIDNKLFLYH